MGFPKTRSHHRRQIKRLLFGRLKADFFFYFRPQYFAIFSPPRRPAGRSGNERKKIN